MATTFLANAVTFFEDEKRYWYTEKYIRLHEDLEEKYTKIGARIVPLKQRERDLLNDLNDAMKAENIANDEMAAFLSTKIELQREIINLPSHKNVFRQQIQLNNICITASAIVHDVIKLSLHDIYKEQVNYLSAY